MELLLLLGYRDDINTIINIKKPSHIEFKTHKELDFNYIHCFVFGSKGCGKTSFITNFIQNEVSIQQKHPYTAVFSISKNGIEKSIIV